MPTVSIIPMGRREAAIVWLAAQLAQGPMAAETILHRAIQAKISARTLGRAKKVLDVRSVRVGGVGGAGGWVWSRTPETGAGP